MADKICGTCGQSVTPSLAGTAETMTARITDYLASGGLFNPELANHDAVRDLLIDCRAELTALRASLATAQEIITEAQASYDSVNFAYPMDDDGRTMEAMILRLSKGKRICGDFAKDIMPDAARPHATPEGE